MKNLKTLVIATALTPESDPFVRTGVEVARATGASVWLLHVYAPPAFPSDLAGASSSWIEMQMEELRARLEHQARETGLMDLPGFSPDRLRLQVGVPHREILALARLTGAGLIVAGATGGGPIRRALLGSTADRLVRTAPCPVLVVRSGAVFPPERVLFPVDLSPLSAAGIRDGFSFLRQLGASPASEVLFVLNPLEMEGSLQFTPEQMERFASTELHQFVEHYAPAGGAALERVRVGYPADEIVAEIGDRRMDLAVMATHGVSGFDRLLLGSVTVDVLRDSPCNVLVVPPVAVQLEGAEAYAHVGRMEAAAC